MQWLSPNDVDDLENDWNDDSKAIDEYNSTYAHSSLSNGETSGRLEFPLNISPAYIDKVMIKCYPTHDFTDCATFYVDVYEDGSWQEHVAAGGSDEITDANPKYIFLNRVYKATKVGFRCDANTGTSGIARVAEFEYRELATTKTAPGTVNLIAEFRMEDNDAQAVVDDSSGNSNNGIIEPDTVHTSDLHSVDGKFNDSFLFRGNDDEYVDLASFKADVGEGDKTFLLWFQKTSPPDNYALIMWSSIYTGILGVRTFGCRLHSNGNLGFYVNASHYEIADLDVGNPFWHLAIMTHDKSENLTRCFIDGILAKELTEEIDFNLNYEFFEFILGATGNVVRGDLFIADEYDGHLDQVCIFNAPLSIEEALWFWKEGNGERTFIKSFLAGKV